MVHEDRKFCCTWQEEGKVSSEGESLDDSSSEDDKELSKEIRRTHRQVNKERRQREWEEQKEAKEAEERQPKFYELKAGEQFGGVLKKSRINK